MICSVYGACLIGSTVLHVEIPQQSINVTVSTFFFVRSDSADETKRMQVTLGIQEHPNKSELFAVSLYEVKCFDKKSQLPVWVSCKTCSIVARIKHRRWLFLRDNMQYVCCKYLPFILAFWILHIDAVIFFQMMSLWNLCLHPELSLMKMRRLQSFGWKSCLTVSDNREQSLWATEIVLPDEQTSYKAGPWWKRKRIGLCLLSVSICSAILQVSV